MTGTQSESDGGTAARLQKIVAEWIPELEEKYWKTETMSGFRSVFEEASKALGKKLGFDDFSKERTSLSAVSEYYAKRKPEEILAMLSRVNRVRFDGGHLILVGIGIFYRFPNKEKNSQPGKMALAFGVFNNGYISVPFEKINFAAYHDPVKGLRDLRRRLAETIDRIAKGDNPYQTKVYRSISYVPPRPDSSYEASDEEWYRMMEIRRRQEDALEADRAFYVSMMLREPENEEHWHDRLSRTGLTDDDISLREWQENRDPTYYRDGDLDYRRWLDERYGPPPEPDYR